MFKEIVNILVAHDHVVAYFGGHYHKGAYEFHQGIHFLTLSGMVETQLSSYAILDIYNDKLILRRYGHQEDFNLDIAL